MRKKILLLEDDYDLANTLKELLEINGYEITMVHRANEAIDASYENSYDLYVFDINVPDLSGIELLHSLRNAEDKTPTIFISALVDLNTIAQGFQVGAQDYIKKPFFPEELLIRIEAKFANSTTGIAYKDLRYDPNTKILSLKDKQLPLSEVQNCLCSMFMQNIGNIIDKSILIDCLTHPSDSALRVAINKLKHLTNLPIKNVRGIGYILEKS